VPRIGHHSPVLNVESKSDKFRIFVFLGLYLQILPPISALFSGIESEIPCVYEFDGSPHYLRLLFAHGRRTGIDGSAKDVGEDLLHVLQLSSP
jgi:hypothetical protein